MRKIRSVLRLHFEAHLSRRGIARSLRLSRDAVTDYLTRAAAAKLTWPLPASMDDAELEQRLFPPIVTQGAKRKAEPNWAEVHQEMRRKGATLLLLHEEYLAASLAGIGYSLFCERYREFGKTLKPSMRQIYTAGDRVFVDYAGPTIPVVDSLGGGTRTAQIFVGVLGASNYIYAEAHWSQTKPDWIAAHARMFAHFGAVPAVVVCDNLKSAVIKASRTEPLLNESYQNMADHYGTIIVPARPHTPRDKAKAEGGVLIVERWILFRLRKRLFTSLGELNEAIRDLLVEINARPFKKLPGSRKSVFDTVDRPAMQPLPATPYEYTEFRKVRVKPDYRVEVDGCEYTVPVTLIRQEVTLRVTAATVEVLHKGKRVANHTRQPGAKLIEDKTHLPPNHLYIKEWSAEVALSWAGEIGFDVRAFLEAGLKDTKTPEQGYRLHGTLRKMATKFGNDRLDASCRKAIQVGAKTTAQLRTILSNRLEQSASTDDRREASFEHANIRGADYYH